MTKSDAPPVKQPPSRVGQSQNAEHQGDFVPLWQKIEIKIRDWVDSGEYPPGSRLPSDRQIAELVDANRLTVRRALASLAQQGILRIEHGVGTFVERKLQYNFGRRVSFSKNLKADGYEPRREILDEQLIGADARLSEKLDIPKGAPVIKVDILGFASDVPIGTGSKFFPYARFPGLMDVYEITKSFSEAFKDFGVDEYIRKYTTILGRLPTSDEARILKQSKTSFVLAYTSVDVDLEGVPVSFQEGCLSADRVVINIESDFK